MNMIHAERDSVCMGDDVNAPNAAELPFENGMDCKQFLRTVAGYVPQMHGASWTVHAGKNSSQIIGILLCRKDGKYTCIPKISFVRGIREIYCAYDRRGNHEAL